MKKVLTTYLVFLFVLLFVNGFTQSLSSINLAGRWQFQIDSLDKGISEKWFSNKLAETVDLPGSMLDNRKGNEVTLYTKWTASIYDSSWFFNPRMAKYRQPGNIKVPFFLTPLKYYVGVAWYQKDIEVPAVWKGKHINLFLERAHIQTTLFVDGQEIGKQNSLTTPHEYDLGNLASGKHTVSIRIDNRLKDQNVGPDSHSVTDHTEGNWNGIIGKMELNAKPLIWISDVQVFPNIDSKTVKVRIALQSDVGSSKSGKINLIASIFNSSQIAVPAKGLSNFSFVGKTDTIETTINIGKDAQLWDEFNQPLYKLTVSLIDAQGNKDEKKTQFGMRKFDIAGTHFQVNGRPVFLRGTVNNCEFPLTGHPPMDEPAWERIFKVAKTYGLNHMRFHSFCPPEAAFDAADRVGFYLQPEGPSWPNHGTSLGDGRFIDKYLMDETSRMVKQYGNHPSFCMLSAGNEPAGRNQAKYLADFIAFWKNADSTRRVYTGASVAMSWPLVPSNQYMIKSGSRGLDWNKEPESESDFHSAIEKFAMPYVTHEMGQWCVYPNLKEIKKYTGNYRAKNFELFQEDLADRGMADMADKFLMASGKLQTLCYKYELEKECRTDGLAGFQMLGLQDFPGQGTAIVGTLDAFWEEKGYTTAAEFREFCNSTVLLAKLPKFVYTDAETLNANIEIFNYGKSPFKNAVINWQLIDDKKQLVNGVFKLNKIDFGNSEIGKITQSFLNIKVPTKLTLMLSLAGTDIKNHYEIWVYPAKKTIDLKDIYFTDTLDNKAEEILNKGGKVFLNIAGKVVKGKEIIQQFTPVFWNTSWFKMRPPHTLGFVTDDKHPMYNSFPTENHSNLQWWEIVNKAQVMHLEDFPQSFRPLIQPIDTWFLNRRLAQVFECKVGNGKLMVTSADLSPDLQNKPAAQQLFASIVKYMESDKFAPATTIDVALIRDLTQTPSKEQFSTFTKDSPDELKPKLNLNPGK